MYSGSGGGKFLATFGGSSKDVGSSTSENGTNINVKDMSIRNRYQLTQVTSAHCTSKGHVFGQKNFNHI